MVSKNIRVEQQEAFKTILKHILFPSIVNSVSKEVKEDVKQAFDIASTVLDIASSPQKI